MTLLTKAIFSNASCVFLTNLLRKWRSHVWLSPCKPARKKLAFTCKVFFLIPNARRSCYKRCKKPYHITKDWTLFYVYLYNTTAKIHRMLLVTKSVSAVNMEILQMQDRAIFNIKLIKLNSIHFPCISSPLLHRKSLFSKCAHALQSPMQREVSETLPDCFFLYQIHSQDGTLCWEFVSLITIWKKKDDSFSSSVSNG